MNDFTAGMVDGPHGFVQNAGFAAATATPMTV
jgi:hypothetical protein